jgi:acyl-homoserine lactone acylase PvdQ
MPGVSLGHNDHCAFALTIFPMDQEDLYVYEIDPENSNRYRYGEGWEEMREMTEMVAVKGHPDQAVTLKFTRHGPVVFEDTERHLAYAVRSVWFEPGASAYLTSLAYMGAQVARRVRAGAAWLGDALGEPCLCGYRGQHGLVRGGAGADPAELGRAAAGARRRALRVGGVP